MTEGFTDSHNAQRERERDRQTDGRIDNKLMPIADHTMQQYDRLKNKEQVHRYDDGR